MVAPIAWSSLLKGREAKSPRATGPSWIFLPIGQEHRSNGSAMIALTWVPGRASCRLEPWDTPYRLW